MYDLTHDLDLSLRDAVALVPREQVFILADTHTVVEAVPKVQLTLSIPESQICVIEAGDKHKTLSTVERVWSFLFEHNATRRALLLNVGGGMVTDLGGFAASTYMRGIEYVNIPTTLLADIDAAAGGKTGFNYNGLKNSIGLFAQPKSVIISVDFLHTLPAVEFLSGFAEMLKHSLISSPLELNRLLAFDIDKIDYEELEALIQRSIVIKNYIVEQDPMETGMRKSLNFGHTIGHALEEMSLRRDEQPMSHGYAVFYGLIAELYLSVKKAGLNKAVIEQCLPLLYNYYGKPQCSCADQEQLISLMQHDKKNACSSEINFTLLHAIGNAWINQTCTKEEIAEAIDYLFSL